MQICFNQRKCPLLRRELPLFQRLLWATGYWVGAWIAPSPAMCYGMQPCKADLHVHLLDLATRAV
jgi:hypothetical protein